MVTGLTYIFVSISLVLILGVASRDRHTELLDGDVFRYPGVITWLSASGAPLWVVGAIVVYATLDEKPSSLALGIYVGVNLVIALLFLWGFVAVRRFSIEIRAHSTYVRDWRGRRRVELERTKRFVTVDGGRGGQEFCLFDGSGKVLLKASSVLQDYEELRTLVQRRLPKQSISYEHRDAFGRWMRTRA